MMHSMVPFLTVTTRSSPQGTGILITRQLPFTNEKFADFICFIRGDRHKYNFFFVSTVTHSLAHACVATLMCLQILDI